MQLRQRILKDAMLLLVPCGAVMFLDSATGNEPTAVISVQDIGTRVKLVGCLGEPLGTMMEVQGLWKYPSQLLKDNSLRFEITRVNGRALAKPIEFNVALVKAVNKRGQSVTPLEGLSWRMRAFETGRHNEIPLDYMKESGKGIGAVPYWFGPFTSELVGVVQER